MYVAVKGGKKAINNSLNLLAKNRRGNKQHAEISVSQISEQLHYAVSRVMSEGALYDVELASLAIKQAQGDLVEAAFLLRAYRTTLPRMGYSTALDTEKMRVTRRISGTYKDILGGQILGSTYDYSHRLLDFKLLADGEYDDVMLEENPSDNAEDIWQNFPPHVVETLNHEQLIQVTEPDDNSIPHDVTREPQHYPAARSQRLQNLARGDEGFLLSLAYSTQRGYGRNHPFVGEMRQGFVSVMIGIDTLGFEICLGEIEVSECHVVNQFAGNQKTAPQFTRGYGLCFANNERKAISMALLDRSLRCEEYGENRNYPAQDEEFILQHSDNIEASGFLAHLKLPHYVDFQSELELIRQLRAAYARNNENATEKQADSETSHSKHDTAPAK